MTLIAGIRRGEHVFLVADSALTGTGKWGQSGHEQRTTSFGEAQILEPLKTVQEVALKIHNFGRIAVATAGDLDQSNDFVSSVVARLATNPAADETLLKESVAPFACLSNLSFQFIAALTQSPAPLLYSFNLDGGGQLIPHSGQGVVCAGSPTEFQTDLFRHILRLLNERLPLDPTAYLAAAVAWLQSLGVRNRLLEQGIGGAFYGVYADSTSVHWQSDVVYGLHHRMSGPVVPVITIIRDDVIIVRSGIDNASRAMWSSISSRVTLDQWRARWQSQDDAVLGSAVRFVVILDTIDWRVALFELDSNRSSRYVQFDGPSKNSDGRIQMLVNFAPEVRSSLMAALEPPASPSGRRVMFAWTPAAGSPRIVQFVVEPT